MAETVRRTRLFLIIGIPIALIVALGAWLWGGVFGTGHPLGDDRACAGSDEPLQPALDLLGLTLPEGADEIRYLTTARPEHPEPPRRCRSAAPVPA
ncbi:hypothetical protein [Streptomyces sp. NPDC060035]|uniref:hypothetical protein n=1 Tax=Streptomyces sp. NPDC060035 TaxID=3347044 RepID=UPI00368A1927